MGDGPQVLQQLDNVQRVSTTRAWRCLLLLGATGMLAVGCSLHWRYLCVLLHASGFCAERSRTATKTAAHGVACCCCRWVMISPRKKEKNRMRDENKKAFYSNPGKSSYPLPEKKKNFGRPPRELQCSDRAQTSTTGSGRASCIDVVLRFWLKVLVRRDKFENRRKNHNYTYTYILLYNICW